MTRRRRLPPLLVAVALLATAGAGAQAPEPSLPRVIYGAPAPNVIYGAPSAAPEQPRRPPPPPEPAPVPPRGSLSYESGPAYLPPGAWLPGWGPPPGWGSHPLRPPPRTPTPYVSPQGGAFEPPLPQGRYVGRPPSAPAQQPRYGRPTPW